MKVDPRFSLSIETLSGNPVLRIAAARELEIEEEVSTLLGIEFAELAELVRLPPEVALEMRDLKRSTIFSNGWQSWSFASELRARERPRRALLGALNLYTDRPGPLARSGEILSHFFTFLRSGEWRLLLVSRGLGKADPGTSGPPISFRICRKNLAIQIEALAGGARFKAGQAIAEIALILREGFFPLKDALKEAFAGYRHFERLAFLGGEGGLVPGGYESWYNHYANIDETLIQADLAALRSNENFINAYYLRRGKPTVFQIDDGWEASVGDWEADAGRFPKGMRALAQVIDEAGLIPGLWLAPLAISRSSPAFQQKQSWLLKDRSGKLLRAGWNPGWGGDFYVLDLSLPEVEDYLIRLFDRIVEDWGYRYLKLDFLYAGLLPGAFARGGAAYEHYDRVLGRIASRVRDARGRPVAWLGCGAPLEPSFRHFPLMRIGADTRETWEWPALKLIGHEGRPAAKINLRGSIGRCILDRTVFLNDPDVLFCREKGMGFGEREKELIALVDRMLASQLMFSDDAVEFGTLREAEFTERIIRLYDRLAGGEYGAERLDRELYRLLSRDGRIGGYINLGRRDYRLREGRPETLGSGKAIVSRFKREGKVLVLEPRSVSISEA